MKAETKYGLHGAFKVDFYEKGKMISGTDWFANFITQTGLAYPITYDFVNCFRYLSLGTSSALNQGKDGGFTPTTGLSSPITSLNTNVGSQPGQYIGYQGYNVGDSNANSPCTTILEPSGPTFFRAWTVPTGLETVNEPGGYLNVQEFMVSPTSGGAPGDKAFSRITRSISIPNGQQVIITYQLAIRIRNSGITPFSANSFTTANADISNDASLVNDWANLSGYYRQSWMGLTCIDPYGAPFMPTMGNGMEPSLTDLSKYTFYLSPDNSQFDVNKNGGSQSDINAAYTSDGLMGAFYPSDLRDIGSTVPTLNDLYYFPPELQSRGVPHNPISNIRLGGNDSVNLPLLQNYSLDNLTELGTDFNYQETTGVRATGKMISYATRGASGFDLGKLMGYQKAAFSSRIYRLPVVDSPTSRTRKITRKTVFPASSALGTNTRYGSLVYAYHPVSSRSEKTDYYPTVDCLFFDSSGRSLMQHYRTINTVYMTERGTGVVDAYITVPNSGDNARFTTRKCFQGGYSANDSGHFSVTTPLTTGADANGYPFGYLFSGNMNSNLVGDATNIVNGGSGSGCVYGCIIDSGFSLATTDIGLANHITGMTSTPAPTGQLYYPYCKAGNEMNLLFTGVKLAVPSLGVVADTGRYFVGGQQIISGITFALSGNAHPTNLKNVSDAPTAGESGYFLTTQKYANTALTSTDNPKFIVGSTYTITGGVDAYRFAANSSPTGTPSNYFRITPLTTTANIAAGTFTTPNAVRVSGFFNSGAPFVDRGYGSAFDNGAGLNVKNNYEFWVSGASGASPVYLTYVYGTATSLTGNSMLTGSVILTQVAGPEGYLMHDEGSGRLLPNHGIPNNKGVNTYYPQAGGVYPGLSLDNNLELYFDISWSAPCGSSVVGGSCIDDPLTL